MGCVRTYIKERITVEDRGYSTHCWIWKNSLGGGGYAQGRPPGFPSNCRIHRISYAEFVGAIPTGLTIDHLCRVRSCVNPDHLEPVTNQENVRRGKSAELKTHCKRGHEMTHENSIYDPRAWRGRKCRACDYARKRNYGYPRKRIRTAARLGCEGVNKDSGVRHGGRANNP